MSKNGKSACVCVCVDNKNKTIDMKNMLCVCVSRENNRMCRIEKETNTNEQ